MPFLDSWDGENAYSDATAIPGTTATFQMFWIWGPNRDYTFNNPGTYDVVIVLYDGSRQFEYIAPGGNITAGQNSIPFSVFTIGPLLLQVSQKDEYRFIM
ncbi:MAG: hypothetical protein FWD40_04245 [Treponema sp.]|nr:hypothetical protein [Treponema sp.]